MEFKKKEKRKKANGGWAIPGIKTVLVQTLYEMQWENVSHCLMECTQSFNKTDGLFVESKLS